MKQNTGNAGIDGNTGTAGINHPQLTRRRSPRGRTARTGHALIALRPHKEGSRSGIELALRA